MALSFEEIKVISLFRKCSTDGQSAIIAALETLAAAHTESKKIIPFEAAKKRSAEP